MSISKSLSKTHFLDDDYDYDYYYYYYYFYYYYYYNIREQESKETIQRITRILAIGSWEGDNYSLFYGQPMQSDAWI